MYINRFHCISSLVRIDVKQCTQITNYMYDRRGQHSVLKRESESESGKQAWSHWINALVVS